MARRKRPNCAVEYLSSYKEDIILQGNEGGYKAILGSMKNCANYLGRNCTGEEIAYDVAFLAVTRPALSPDRTTSWTVHGALAVSTA